jgi:hypothetical protein
MVLLMRLVLVAFALSLAGCFNIEDRVCAYACGPNKACPDDYQCMPDGYCHLHGNRDPCGYSDAGADQSVGDQASSVPSVDAQ